MTDSGERFRAYDVLGDGISFVRMYVCQVTAQGAERPPGAYVVVEAKDEESAGSVRDAAVRRSVDQDASIDSFVTGRFCVMVMWRGDDSQAGETLLTNLKNAAGYTD